MGGHLRCRRGCPSQSRNTQLIRSQNRRLTSLFAVTTRLVLSKRRNNIFRGEDIYGAVNVLPSKWEYIHGAVVVLPLRSQWGEDNHGTVNVPPGQVCRGYIYGAALGKECSRVLLLNRQHRSGMAKHRGAA